MHHPPCKPKPTRRRLPVAGGRRCRNALLPPGAQAKRPGHPNGRPETKSLSFMVTPPERKDTHGDCVQVALAGFREEASPTSQQVSTHDSAARTSARYRAVSAGGEAPSRYGGSGGVPLNARTQAPRGAVLALGN